MVQHRNKQAKKEISERNNTCDILLEHHKLMEKDPERLSTEFLGEMLGFDPLTMEESCVLKKRRCEKRDMVYP